IIFMSAGVLSINAVPSSLVSFASDATIANFATLNRTMKIVFEILLTVLAADFVSGLVHWLEDAYGREHWPITGRLVTRPNILHHHDPRYFTRHNWLQSSWLL